MYQDPDIQRNKDAAAMSYLWILGVLMLFWRKDSKFIQFHAKQSTFLFVASCVIYFVPYLYYLNILVFAAMLVGGVTALQGEFYKMPVVYTLLVHGPRIKEWPSAIRHVWHYVQIRIAGRYGSHHEAKAIKRFGDYKVKQLKREIEHLEGRVRKDMKQLEMLRKELSEFEEQQQALGILG